MAITRCPYCHAIIDEADKYCNNCGTQLLFAEDDEVEEEIPGEKIIDAEVEEKDYTINEPEEEKRRKPAKDLDSEIDKELAEGMGAEEEGPRLDEMVEEEEPEADDVTEEVILVDEIEAAEKAAPDGSAELAAAPGQGPAGEGREDRREDKGEAADKDRDDDDTEDEEDEEGEHEEDDEDLEDEEDEDLELPEDEEEEEGVEEDEEEDEEAGPGRDEDEDEDEDEDKDKDKDKDEEAVQEKGEDAEQAPEPLPPAPVESEPEVEYVVEPVPPDEASTAGEAAFRAATFDTKELESLGRTVELSRAKVDELIENLSARRSATPPQEPELEPPPAGSTPPTAAPIPLAPAPAPEPEPEEIPPGPMAATPTGSLPPWASTMKGAPVFSEDSGPVETRKFRRGTPAAAESEEEVEIFPRKRGVDSTIGLPEKIGQSPLPFDETAAEPDEEEMEEELGEAGAEEEEAAAAEGTASRDITPEEVVLPGGVAKPARGSVLPGREAAADREAEAEAADEYEAAEERPPFSFSVFIRSKAFDVLFVGLFWLVALWLAAASLGVTLFAILASMSGPMLLLYAVFLIIYVFLFKFFLGETLGDRLFKPRE